MQALLLAAGMGNRLGKYTNNNTKCMVEVAGKKLIDRAISAIKQAKINKMIVVLGYKGENLKNYILETHKNSSIEFIFIDNKDYATSNNIYSFYLAKDHIIKDDTILLESDLIYEEKLIKEIADLPQQNVVAIAKYKSWMDGTIVTINNDNYVTSFMDKTEMDLYNVENYFKTVNIYKFSKDFCKNIYIPFLEAYMKGFGLNSYYETVLKIVPSFSENLLYGYEIGDTKWYEIDDAQDLDIANVLFEDENKKYDLMISKCGGYWRYNNILNFYSPTNSYFPTQKMKDKLQVEFSRLLGAYPSGLSTQNLNTERMFEVNQDYIILGNGAAELINSLGHITKGKIAVGLPTFNEYIRCFKNSEIIKIDNSINNYKHDIQAYIQICKEVELLCIVTPNNPSGDMLNKHEIISLLEKAKKHNTKVLIDESFIDFADNDKKFTILTNEILEKYPNLVVIKSIGKSYGVAGLRLGIIATSDTQLLQSIKNDMQIWNINSMAEYFMQIFNNYKKAYILSCEKIALERNRMIYEINKIDKIKAFPSQANFIMVDLKDNSSYDFCVNALNNYNILIKDLSTKNHFNGKNYIRIAVRDEKDNDKLLNYIKTYFN